MTDGDGFDVFPESDDDLLRGLTEIDELAERNNRRPRIAVLTSDANAEGAPYLSIVASPRHCPQTGALGVEAGRPC